MTRLYIFFLLIYSVFCNGATLIPVKFGIADTLYKEDDTPCGNYKETIAAAINYGIGENSKPKFYKSINNGN